jgi:hypothetical protein
VEAHVVLDCGRQPSRFNPSGCTSVMAATAVMDLAMEAVRMSVSGLAAT